MDTLFKGGQKGTNVLTLTEGIVGPIVPQFPLNITKILDLPQVTADEAIFCLGQIIHFRQRTPTHYQINDERSIKNTLSSAYQRLLAHQNEDGSFIFCLMGHFTPPASTFLTASALDVLRRLQSEPNWLVVDSRVLRKTLRWLISQQSPEDGSFREKFVFDGIYQRKIPIEFQEIALTSHVLMALAGFSEFASEYDVNITRTMDR